VLLLIGHVRQHLLCVLYLLRLLLLDEYLVMVLRRRLRLLLEALQT